MKPETRNRLIALAAILVAGSALAWIAFGNIGENLVYYWKPSEMMAQAFLDHRHRGFEVRHQPTARGDQLAIGRTQHHAAARGQHHRRVAGEDARDHRLLGIAKGGFTLGLEERGDRHAELVFDLTVGIDERPRQARRHQPPDGGFSTGAKADEGQAVEAGHDAVSACR